MNILFLCGLFPRCYRDEIEKKSIGSIQYAADTLQWAIVNGLDNYANKLKLINLPYIGSFPFRYKELKTKSFVFSHNGISIDENVGFLNLSVYKFVSRYLNSLNHIKKWASDTRGEKALLVYAFHTPFLKAAYDIKKAFPEVKLCLIIPDLPHYMNHTSSKIKSFLNKVNFRLQKIYLMKFDSFVVLSKHMVDFLNLNKRPWICVEGIFDDNSYRNIKILPCRKVSSNNKIIFYSGTIAARYGILTLLNAFKKIEKPNYRLWICGDGDTREIIKREAKTDNRIFYYGQLPRENVLKLQTEATVLINPRAPNDEFTKYSFPSKTMEYFASGTPTIMFNLEGIPEEYFKYCFKFEGNSATSMANTIIKICEMDPIELQQIGNRARNFIINYKNPLHQCRKIYELLLTLQ